jgi:2-keto-3-deoxy-galactonokinase
MKSLTRDELCKLSMDEQIEHVYRLSPEDDVHGFREEHRGIFASMEAQVRRAQKDDVVRAHVAASSGPNWPLIVIAGLITLTVGLALR